MTSSLRERVAALIEGEVFDDAETRKKYSRDTSIFEQTPDIVVFPKHEKDIAALVCFVRKEKEQGRALSLTARAGGTDMTGGPLTRSILVCTKHMNALLDANHNGATVEAGMYYKDFEREVLKKTGMLLPSFPASKETCVIGGMVANNAGGELSLTYGKTDRYVQELDVILSDGSSATLKPLSLHELSKKKSLQTFEGELYRNIHSLLEANKEVIESARPHVSKNSAGYALWDVWNPQQKTFDLTKLICGSQGTLAFITRAKLGLVKPKAHRAMLVVFLQNLTVLPDVVHRVLKFNPEAFESYDDHTFKLAVRYGWQFLQHLGLRDALKLTFAFLPEVWMTITGGIPKLVLIAEFAEDSEEDAREAARSARASLHDIAIEARLAFGKAESEKYWKIRRESFSLLRKNFKGLRASPFIDDIIVHPDDYPRFLPELTKLLATHNIIYTIAGHIGDANFHIIPLIDLGNPEHRKAILELTPKVYELVARYKGSITGEHSDGIIRTPYLSLMFSPRALELFVEVKKIFDPLGIFNPGKKVGGTLRDIETLMIHSSPKQ